MQPADSRAQVYEQCRRELTAYAARMLSNRAVAEDLTQEAAVRLFGDNAPRPDDAVQIRAWLFRVVTNLALDHIRRHSTWRELPLLSARERAGKDEEFVAASVQLKGNPEMRAIAREHLVVCFGCTLRNLRPQEAAALLLKEVYGLTVEETASAVGATFNQVKNWLQAARATLELHYESTCALTRKNGVCYQCVELDDFFNGERRNPMGDRAPASPWKARLDILRAEAATVPGRWHERVFRLMDDVLDQL